MSRNFGIGSRHMFNAGRMAVRRWSPGGIKTQEDTIARWRLFVEWAAERGVKKMENVSAEVVAEYGRYLQEQLDSGRYTSASTPKNYLSAVNRVMDVASQWKWNSVLPGRDCGIERRSYIPDDNTKAVTETTHLDTVSHLDDRLAAIVMLQRKFGLRFKESVLLSPKRALREVEKQGRFRLHSGTKGGRPRWVACDGAGVSVLRHAATIQDGRSMVPASMTYGQFLAQSNAAMNNEKTNFHGERHAYAQKRYRDETGAPCPLEAGWEHRGRIAHLAEYLGVSVEEAKVIDHEARMKIAKELGHSRKEITNAYLG